jgi:hypothetical protein
MKCEVTRERHIAHRSDIGALEGGLFALAILLIYLYFVGIAGARPKVTSIR